MERLLRGEVAERAGVNPETVRYYERRGLIPEPERNESNYRLYRPDVVDRIRFVREAKELGFRLDEIRELLELRADDEADCAEVKARVEARLRETEERIRRLEELRDALDRLRERCPGEGPTAECPIIDELGRGDLLPEDPGEEGPRAE